MSDGKSIKFVISSFINDMKSNIEVFKTNVVIGEV